ncbi:MAG: hypothetical protein ACI9KN_001624 [Gammaproteobacteria bacterium]|jgi:hypothetical protein
MERSDCGNPFASGGKRDCRVAGLLAMTGSGMFQHFYRLDNYHSGSVPNGTEAMIADPVYEGKSMQGMIDLVKKYLFPEGSKVLFAHLGGVPTLNGYSYTYTMIKY